MSHDSGCDCLSCQIIHEPPPSGELTPHELATALRETARGSYAQEAACELLIDHGYWLTNPILHEYAQVATDRDGTVYAAIGDHDEWSALITAADYSSGCTSSEYGILRIAASLAADIPVKLRNACSSLDRHSVSLVGAAIGHLDGDRGGWVMLEPPPLLPRNSAAEHCRCCGPLSPSKPDSASPCPKDRAGRHRPHGDLPPTCPRPGRAYRLVRLATPA